MFMFWGLVLEPSKKYSQKVQQSFHLSQAALELSDGECEPVQLVLEFEGACYVLGTLSRRSCLYQIPLDLNFNSGDHISFRTIGRARVHLTGYHWDVDQAPKDEEGRESAKKRPTNAELLLQSKRRHAEFLRIKGLKKLKLDAAKKFGRPIGIGDDDDDDDSEDDSDEDAPVVVVPGSDDELTPGVAGHEAEAVENDEGAKSSDSEDDTCAEAKKKVTAARKSGISVALKPAPKIKKMSPGTKQIFSPRPPFSMRQNYPPQPIFISQSGFPSRPVIMTRPLSKTTRKEPPTAKRTLKSDKKNLKGEEKDKTATPLRRQASK